MPDSGAVLKTELKGSSYKLGIRAERRKGGAVNSKDGNSRYHQLSQSRLEKLWVQEGRAGLGVLCVGVKSAMPVNIQVEVFNAQFYICIYIYILYIFFIGQV